MQSIQELYGSNVFNLKVMQERLPKDTFKALKKTIEDGTPLELDVANQVAHAMKEWAIEKGATHFTHWFQPMTGYTAEKHDSFIVPTDDGGVIMSLSGKELTKGEPDASSFPSGGRRATFEARGYTVWDPTAFAFVKEHSLCIPTAFCSYTGEALDKKTPLLRSMQSISRQSVRILRMFGNRTVKRVVSSIGAEQEYFLIDEKLYYQRKDLRMTGRTLFGAKPSKGQEMDDQYYGALKTRISDYMEALNKELWKVGIPAKTEHNEVAPAQHEMAPIYAMSNVAADQNQLAMEIMKKVARKHGMVCLLHEKPFAGVNGSGKHNNWSISTTEGENLLDPGKTPRKNAQFLLFLTAVIKAVDENQDLLRISVASAGNDHRLGANEAPPAIMSIYLGEELESILESIKDGTPYSEMSNQKMTIGADVLPAIPKDTTDRNRTSPFAFTGNKFEFRSVGSSLSISGPATTLNAIVAHALKEFADELEGAKDFNEALHTLIKREITAHWKIIFNGNGYDESWVKEAEKRGLLNLKTLPVAMAEYLKPKNIKLFTDTKIYSEVEMKSRYEVKLEKYCQVLNIEVETMLEMVNKDILPATFKYLRDVSNTQIAVKAITNCECSAESAVVNALQNLADRLSHAANNDLFCFHEEAKKLSGMDAALYYSDVVIPQMQKVRSLADQIEPYLGEEYKPYPSYEDLMFRV
ncbi:MAG: glutamine synthetase III [Treponema sp.]|nr:glutamine synthetase III [Spirochaetia bacterium]MDD6296004.1 glutamine synthetase III [Treponema sp.]MDD7449657.1 glutamine synthetase III [Treponema sp.]MDY2925128.1 glutamine synthetase III [Treponema sp.]MDY5683374.1 glutamine synthetase III [Treponema sp.]